MGSDQSKTLHYSRARFVAELPCDCLYTPSHWWLSPQEDQTWQIGLTKLGSRLLGEMVDYGFEITAGTSVRSGQVIGWIESFKALSDVRSLVTGTFLGANPALEHSVTLINQDPFGAGWVYAVKGIPAAACIEIGSYVSILDKAIDDLVSRHP